MRGEETEYQLGLWTSISSSANIVYSIRLEGNKETDRDRKTETKLDCEPAYQAQLTLSSVSGLMEIKRQTETERQR